MDYIIDTCTFLWICSEEEKLSQVAKDIFVNKENTIYLSVVSSWEMAIKYNIGKLNLPATPEIYIPQQRKVYHIESLELDEKVCLHSYRLPNLHKDPFDRILISQSVILGYPILTPDKLIQQYGVSTIW